MKPTIIGLLGVTLVLAACSDRPQTPTAVNATPMASVTPTANSPCTVHWASGVSGSWFVAANWSPAAVPTSSSSVCIDAAGTYTVTLDPAVDTTPVDILALDVGGSGATPTLTVSGTNATINLAEGINVRSGATLQFRTSTAGVINSTGTVTNAGTLAYIAPCGGCGSGGGLNGDVINQGTWTVTAILTLGKVGGSYQNTGTIDLQGGGSIMVPASAGNATFDQDGGVITGFGNFQNVTMAAGTFNMNGGKARPRNASNDRPMVLIDGADLVLNASATDTAVIGMHALSTTTRTITGDVPALTRLWLSGPLDGQPGTINWAGNPTNRGTIYPAAQITNVGGTLTLSGSGALTNAGTVSQSKSSGSGKTFHYALDIVNDGTMLTSDGTHLAFDKAGGNYNNRAMIDLGTNSSVMELRVVGSTLVNQDSATITGGTLRVDGGRFLGRGTLTTDVLPVNGGTVEPGFSAGKMTVLQFRPTATGILKVELGGVTAGTEYDQLEATQSSILTGTLDISEINGFQFGCGNVFDVLIHPHASGYGTFSTITGTSPAANRTLRVMYINATATTKGIVRLIAHDATAKACIGSPGPLAEGGASAQYAVALDHAPTASVTITPTPDAQVTVSPASLTFTTANWQMPQSFTITAVDDTVVEGNHTGTVTHAVTSSDASYNGYAPSALVANISDNDSTTTPPPPPPPGSAPPPDFSVSLSARTTPSGPNTVVTLGVTVRYVGPQPANWVFPFVQVAPKGKNYNPATYQWNDVPDWTTYDPTVGATFYHEVDITVPAPASGGKPTTLRVDVALQQVSSRGTIVALKDSNNRNNAATITVKIP